MTQQIRLQKDASIYRDSHETTVLFNGSTYTLVSNQFYPFVVVTNFNHMIGFESMESIDIKSENIKTIAI